MSKSKKVYLSPVTALREILAGGEAGTQEELRIELEKKGLEITQSTISRCLRKLGAIKAFNADGEAVYQLPGEVAPPAVDPSLSDLVMEVVHNEVMIVVRTSPGGASLIARQIDHHGPDDVLGTIAGDDTVFVVPSSNKAIKRVAEEIRELFRR